MLPVNNFLTNWGASFPVGFYSYFILQLRHCARYHLKLLQMLFTNEFDVRTALRPFFRAKIGERSPFFNTLLRSSMILASPPLSPISTHGVYSSPIIVARRRWSLSFVDCTHHAKWHSRARRLQPQVSDVEVDVRSRISIYILQLIHSNSPSTVHTPTLNTRSPSPRHAGDVTFLTRRQI